MKKIVLYFSLAILMASCQQVNTSTASTLATSDPIMPIRMFSDTTHVVLTDYLPILYADTALWNGMQWTTSEQRTTMKVLTQAVWVQLLPIPITQRLLQLNVWKKSSSPQ